ncbi:hypothetical protein BCR42DRAFT_413520 [Absidia repens]|uniref:MARVEL domain-containing protein n=1 Tax=Absidia repens TaxID=90262 RepID=A0A1X2IHU4_9FUNG|nr:hypothetical protein BCR42DRAFT_413520 [Absidia repens]
MNQPNEQVDEPNLKPSLQKYTLLRLKTWLHILQVISTLLSASMVAPVIAVQLRFKGSSAPGPNYVLFVIVFTFLIPIFLALFPWLYETKNQMKRCGKFFLKPRTNLIFSGFYSLLWMTAGIAITTYGFNPDTCMLDSTQKANDYASAWTAQCNCAKAAVAFVWLTCLLWIITLCMAVIIFWKQKQLVQKNLQHMANAKQETVEMDTEILDQHVESSPTDNNNHHGNDHSTPSMPYQQSSSPNDHTSPVDHHHHHQQYYSANNMTPPIHEPYYHPSFAAQPYPSSSLTSMHLSSNTPQHQQPQYYPPSSTAPQLQQLQQFHYSDPSVAQQHPPSMPLAVMPDPQHYRQQHRVV